MDAKIEAEQARILKQIGHYMMRGHIEELTYLVGVGMVALEILGCPLKSLCQDVVDIVDHWANSKQAPERQD